jgi:hypothetical protein
MFDASSTQNEIFFFVIATPAAADPTAAERRSGKQCRPADIGDSLFTTWNLCGRLMIVTMYGKPTKKTLLLMNESCRIAGEECNTHASEAATILFFTIRNGKTATIAVPTIPLDRMASQMPKASQQTPATAKLAMMGLLSQGYFKPPSCRANTSIAEPAINKMNPIQST